MKVELAVVVLAATGAFAAKHHKAKGGGHHKNNTMTVTSDSCPSEPATLVTVTNGITVTYCPMCESMGSPGYTTVYTTTYESLCPTGMVPATYTVTESCTEPTPTWTPGPGHIPQGFTVTTKECTVCAATPSPVTITEPCGCMANEGTPMATPAPTKPSVPLAPGPACDGEDCGGEANTEPAPAANGAPAPAANTGAAAPPYPIPTHNYAAATGVVPTGAMPSVPAAPAAPGAPAGTPMSPPSNAASSFHSLALFSSSLSAVLVAVLAFAL